MTADFLDAHVLIDEARRRTGSSDFGDASFPARLSLAIGYLRSRNFDEPAQRAAADVCLHLLTSRLKFFADFKRYPIADEKIERPLFATGEGRSGTTLLHALLAADPDGRSLRFWEVMYPSPPPGLSTPDDPRPAMADDDWRDILKRLPKWLVSHPYNDMLGDGLPECERTWAFDFRVLTPTAWWRVPMGPVSSGLPSDSAAQYRLHKMMLQYCQYARPKKYWVLKGFHQHRLKALFDTYPDARIIWVHRDPVQAIASRIKLSGELTEMLEGKVDWQAYGAIHREGARASFAQTLRDPLVADPRIYHVPYRQFVNDPVGTLRAFYGHAGVPFKSATEQAMRNYLAGNRADRYGRFQYSTDLIGTDIEALHAEFAPYRERFGCEIERRT
jgi:Sulfotransferase family